MSSASGPGSLALNGLMLRGRSRVVSTDMGSSSTLRPAAYDLLYAAVRASIRPSAAAELRLLLSGRSADEITSLLAECNAALVQASCDFRLCIPPSMRTELGAGATPLTSRRSA